MMESAMYLDDLRAALELSPPLDVLSGKTVLITGATGLIGSFLVDMLMLHGGVSIYALSRNGARLQERFARHLQSPIFHSIAWDVANKLDIGVRFDYIIHAASPAHPLAFSTDPVGTMRANITGTENLLTCGDGFGRLLFLSTGEVYGEQRAPGANFSEGDMGALDSAAWRSCYPESKRAAETLCASYVRQFGADCVIARLCYVYGATITPDNSRADAQFLRNALAKQDIVMKSAGSQVRTYMYIADAVAAIMWVLLNGANGEAYNISNPDSILSVREFAELIAKSSGVNLRFEAPPELEAQGYSAISRSTIDPSKLYALGFRARFGPEEGVARMIGTHIS